MDSDGFIFEGLRSGRYDVDVTTGIVTNFRGKVLAAAPDRDGYAAITVYLGPGKQGNVHVHRMVALKAWGADAIRDRQVGHLDQDKTHNSISNLWLPESIKKHYEIDGLEVNLLAGQLWTKSTWEPCVRCGDVDGLLTRGCKTPVRVKGDLYGIQGDLCWRCYRALFERFRRQRRNNWMATGFHALSVIQPHASLIAGSMKTNETRSWSTDFKGRLFVHASKGFPKEYQDLCITSPFREALKQLDLMPPDLRPMDKILPLGSIIAVVNLVGCYPTGRYIAGAPPAPARDSWEYAFGDYGPKRWFWRLEDVHPITPAIPCRGMLNVWAIPERVAGVLRDMGYSS